MVLDPSLLSFHLGIIAIENSRQLYFLQVNKEKQTKLPFFCLENMLFKEYKT